MIKNLILDFGDVLINLDKAAVPRALSQMGFSHADPELEHLARTYEKGLRSTDQFLKDVGERLGISDTAEIISIWNRTILDFPLARLSFLEGLRSDGRFRLFLLSNTNELHMKYVQRTMGEIPYARFKACFEGFYLSYLIQLRKPEPEIFRYVLELNRLDPAETLFVDDTQEHIVSAASLGIQTWNLQPGQDDIRQLLERI
jgi:putative hydrolase of the HAD superfamily